VVHLKIGRLLPALVPPCPPPSSHDFNSDCTSDILWRDTSGNTAAWLMNGKVPGTILQAGGYGQVPTTWSIVGQRDFNGDGNYDLLWRDTSGNTAIWLLKGLSISQAGILKETKTVLDNAAIGVLVDCLAS
jgi:hypothetical protein